MVEEARHSFDRIADVTSELGRAVTQHVEPAWGESGCSEVAAEPGVERRARHAAWAGASLPERRPRVDRRERQPSIAQRGA